MDSHHFHCSSRVLQSDLYLYILLSHIAPIDGHGVPGDKRGSIGTEPDDSFRHFFRGAQASHRLPCDHLLFKRRAALEDGGRPSEYGCSLDRHNSPECPAARTLMPLFW